MKNLDEIINESRDGGEVKRALGVKMRVSGMATSQICELLNVSAQYVSKWHGTYLAEGTPGLLLGYQGSESYLSGEARTQVIEWISGHETISPETVRDYVEGQFGVVYQSKQSYYDLLAAVGLSYHKSQKQNPKRDEAQVKERRAAIKKSRATLVRDK